jgi:hypothetical protein
MIFEKNYTERKLRVSIFSTIFVVKFFHSQKNEANYHE